LIQVYLVEFYFQQILQNGRIDEKYNIGGNLVNNKMVISIFFLILQLMLLIFIIIGLGL